MKLQGELAAAFARRIVQVDAQLAVEPRADVAADGLDLVVVPVALLDVAARPICPREWPGRSLRTACPTSRADVGLVAAHFVEAVQRLGAELHAAVAFVLHQLDVERQSEILGRQVAQQKRVAPDSRAAADDLAVLDRPQPRLAVQPVRSRPLKKAVALSLVASIGTCDLPRR